MRWPFSAEHDGAPSGIDRAGFALAKHLPPGRNRCYSPLSAALALRMLLPGLRGETAQQVQRLFGVSPSLGPSEAPFAETDRVLRTLLSERSLRIANGLWTSENMTLNAEYAALLKTQFGVHAMQIQGDPVTIVNEWVSECTDGQITRLLDHVDPLWNLLLTSAFHYKGGWSSPFSERLTRSQFFQTVEGSREVQMMNDRNELTVAQLDTGLAVQLPLEDNFVFLALLPKEMVDPWPWLLDGGGALIRAALTQGYGRKTILAIPKFSVGDQIDLMEPLRQAGARQLFRDGDFSGIGRFAMKPVVDDIVQSTTFRIDERGVEASAVTGVSLGSASGEKPIQITLDRPFAYVLLHRPTRANLMIGTCDDPSLIPSA